MKNKDSPLSTRIEDSKLVIEIGISTLAFCLNQVLWNEGAEGEIKVENEEEFAKDILQELDNEDEIGASILTDALDKAIKNAMDNGSLGLKYLEE